MEKKSLSKFESDCESIRKNIKECGQLYILIAYKVYELYFYETYKEKYKNIVECCEAEFGFKKSTTYSLIGIVEKFGERELSGKIAYQSMVRYDKFSYSQLSEMLSLSPHQREKITPKTTVSEIRKIKKEKNTNTDIFQSTGKINNSVIVGTPKIEKPVENPVIEVNRDELKLVEVPEPEKVQKSEKIKKDLVKQQLDLYGGNVEKTIFGLINDCCRYNYSSIHFRSLFEKSEKELADLSEELKKLKEENRNIVQKIREVLDCKTFNIDEQIDIIKNNLHDNSKLTKRNAILTTDNEQLRTALEQRDSEIKQLKKRIEQLES